MGIPEIFGINVFGDDAMKQYLTDDVYQSLRHTIAEGKPLDAHIAGAVAEGMKQWAVERGATHFSHWFQPMTGITAEKHDSFLSIKNGKPMMVFSGKELIKGEPDASSLPSGGIRATFEARGYTAWDPSSYAFIKENTLCIPTAFCSYGGHALDKKTPLLRSMEALNRETLRILKLFGHSDVKRALPTVGAEQEYFLVDKKLYDLREDLVITGRTLFGLKSPKGQELNDHYFGIIPQRVAAFMKDLDEELWKLGVYAKTEHNETAPAQHELAPIFTTANIAADQNQLTMAVMKRVAEKHGMVCLLHEKPFATINGSGKHINWSITTDTGVNLFEPGSSPAENAQFLLFLVAVMRAVDHYQDLLRMSVASAGNDCRLGGHEAPPAIISMFIGEDLTAVLEGLCQGNKVKTKRKTMNLGVDLLPNVLSDATDRNRTSPFAFTGNKFEFRMPGSDFSISEPIIVLNTIMAESLGHFADELEKATDFNAALNMLVSKTIRKHKRILFAGNNYAEEWQKEAEKRGLSNLPSADVAIPCMLSRKNIELFEKQGVLSQIELTSRTEILLENYSKTIGIEASTMSDMVRRQYYPAVVRYLLSLNALQKEMGNGVPSISLEKVSCRLAQDAETMMEGAEKMEQLLSLHKAVSHEEESHFYHNEILPLMQHLREIVDEAEGFMPRDGWPVPDYVQLLFSIS